MPRGRLLPGHEHVVRHLEIDRAGAPTGRLMEGLVGEALEVLRVVGHRAPLGERGDHPLLVDVLHRSPAASLERGPSADQDQRHVPDRGVCEPGERIGEARTRGHRGHPGPAGGEGKALGRHRDGALVAQPDDPDVGVDAAVQQLDDVAAPQSKERLHAVGTEAFSH